MRTATHRCARPLGSQCQYAAVGGRASHHNAYYQVFSAGPDVARIVWVTDLLPEEMKAPIEQMVEEGIRSIQHTLGEAFQGR